MIKEPGWVKSDGKLNANNSSNLLSVISFSIMRGIHTTTYKYCFLKSLLDNLYYVSNDYTLLYEQLATSFASIYWNMINVYGIPQMTSYVTGARSSIEKTIERIIDKKPYLKGRYYDVLSEKDRMLVDKNIYNIFSKYVIGAFYEDTSGMIYGFSKNDKKIWLNEKSLSFLKDNKIIIEQMNYYNWLKNIEGILKANNQTIDNLSTILECITKRRDLSPYKEQLASLGDKNVCFYCGKPLSRSKHLDHVIPWDFIRNDDLWNLVFSCAQCNSSKNNKIPDKKYINALLQRNLSLGIEMPNIYSLASDAALNGFMNGWNPEKRVPKNLIKTHL